MELTFVWLTLLLAVASWEVCSGGYSGSGVEFYGPIDPNDEDHLRVLTRGQAFFDSATHQINLLQGNSTSTPGLYLGEIIRKDFANQRLVLYANGKNLTNAPGCVAQAVTDFGAIATVISHENDTIPEAGTNGGILLEGEPYYLQTLQANAAAFNPLVRMGQANKGHPNPGHWLAIWIKLAQTLIDYQAWLNTGDASQCTTQNIALGNAFLSFLGTPAQ